jgi:para-nitrobenzyl esterase
MPNEKAAERSPLRQTSSGLVRGTNDGATLRFLGIPYAAPPTGENRFREPRPVPTWDGVRKATDPGHCAPHKIRDFPKLDIAPLVGEGGHGGEDYLTLNVWAPVDAHQRPVMVFIHGGAFILGSKDAAIHDGTAFARSGVVSVAINYRLGIEGFLPIPGVPTNLGLRDMIAALKWVRDNIAEFGGDPANVTVFGESAGAMAIADLIVSPMAKGLFKRAIIQSGHGSMVRELPVAQRLVKKMAKLLKVEPTERGFRKVDFESGWGAIEKLAKPWAIDLRDLAGHEPVFGISRFIPVFGDDVLPAHPLDALKNGAGKDVELLIGTNSEEMNLYFVPTGVKAKLPGFLARWLLGRSHPTSRRTLKAYGMGQRGKKPGAAFTEALNDLVFRWPARRYAEEHQGRTHLYEFEWRSTALDGELGACHGIEMPFVFKTLEKASGPDGLAGENPPADLADRVHKLWVGFATDGSLPWPEFDRDGRKVHLLSADKTVSEQVMPAACFLP